MMRCALLLYLVALLVSSTVYSGVSPGISVASLRLNEVMPGPGSDWDGDLDADSKKDEWVEVVNGGATACDLSDCLLLNGDGRAVVYGFSGSLAPGGIAVVYGSDATAWEGDNGHSAIGLSLNNSGDVVWLAEVSAGDTVIVDSLEYSSSEVGYDVSIGRSSDASGTWELFDHFMPMDGNNSDPTPGESNSSDPAPHLFAITRDPLFPVSGDSTHIIVEAGDATGISRVLLAYDINLEDGEEPEMALVSGTDDLGTWKYTIAPCTEGDTVHYRVSLFDLASSTVSPWMGYRVRSEGLQVRLNEILADPPADLEGDANNDGERDASDDEFIEIVNCGPTVIDISGWILKDASSVRHVFPDTGMIVNPGEFVTVFGGGSPTGFSGKVFTASSGGLGLANTGDVVSLVDAEASLVDIHSYGSEGGRDESLMRFPDCSDEWMQASDAGLEVAFSPQEPNSGGTATTTSTWGTIKALFK
jgi:hypothetical protein